MVVTALNLILKHALFWSSSSSSSGSRRRNVSTGTKQLGKSEFANSGFILLMPSVTPCSQAALTISKGPRDAKASTRGAQHHYHYSSDSAETGSEPKASLISGRTLSP